MFKRFILYGLGIMLMLGVLSVCNNKLDNDSHAYVSTNMYGTEIIAAPDISKLPKLAKDRKDTIIFGISELDGILNPLYASSTSDEDICSVIFDSLIVNDRDLQPVGELANNWSISSDNKTYTFSIHPGVKFSNGEELTTRDIAFTFTALSDPSYDGSNHDAVIDILGYDEYNSGEATTLSGINVIDEYNISFTFKEVNAAAIWKLGVGIIPYSIYNCEKGAVAETFKKTFNRPVGSGPYKLVNVRLSQSVELTINEQYWGGADFIQPKVKNIIFRIVNSDTLMQDLSTGEIDYNYIPSRPETVQQALDMGFLTVQKLDSTGFNYIGINTLMPKLSDKRTRQALAYGFDRYAFVESYRKGYGIVALSPWATVSWAYSNTVNPYRYDLEKASTLLSESGWEINAKDNYRYRDGEKLSLKLLISANDMYSDALLPVMIAAYKKIGIELIPDQMEYSARMQKVFGEHDFELYMSSWSTSLDPDVRDTLGEVQLKLGGYNAVGWAPDESLRLMDAALRTVNQEERKERYSQWASLFNEECPYILLDVRKDVYVISARISGWVASPYYTYINQIKELAIAE